jgi:hypothetical protein
MISVDHQLWQNKCKFLWEDFEYAKGMTQYINTHIHSLLTIYKNLVYAQFLIGSRNYSNSKIKEQDCITTLELKEES